jgi:hypothetical protein
MERHHQPQQGDGRLSSQTVLGVDDLILFLATVYRKALVERGRIVLGAAFPTTPLKKMSQQVLRTGLSNEQPGNQVKHILSLASDAPFHAPGFLSEYIRIKLSTSIAQDFAWQLKSRHRQYAISSSGNWKRRVRGGSKGGTFQPPRLATPDPKFVGIAESTT